MCDECARCHNVISYDMTLSDVINMNEHHHHHHEEKPHAERPWPCVDECRTCPEKNDEPCDNDRCNDCHKGIR